MADRVSPEERLFNIIKEGRNSAPSGGDSANRKTPTAFRRIREFFGSLKFRLKAIASRQTSTPALALSFKFDEIEPKSVNRALIAILVFLIILFVPCAFRVRPNIAKLDNEISKTKFQPWRKDTVETFKPLDFYLTEIKNRDIFKAVPKEETKDVAAAGIKEVQVKLQEVAKDLKLVGIAWGNIPKAMIRSEAEKDTFFLKKGQTIGKSPVEVREILKNKVTIGYQDEVMELQ